MERADDAEALAAVASSPSPLGRINPYRYLAPGAPLSASLTDGAPPPDYGVIADGLRALHRASDAVIVEEAWSLDAAIDESHDYASLAAECGLEVILVAARQESFIAAAARIVDHARRHRLPVRGIILNCLAAASPADIARDAGRLALAVRVPLLGTVRYKEPLGLSIVSGLV
jgi:dethiobiotin synthetase